MDPGASAFISPRAGDSFKRATRSAYDDRVRGDRVEVVMDIGSGVQVYEIEATKAGRRVEIASSRGTIEVAEVTRTGRPIRTGRFMTARVIAIVEHPSEDQQALPSRRRSAKGQSALL